MIIGENGTGKELVAKQIHDLSERSKQIFMKVDLGSITETLFESELFGHTKGSFTDAKEDRPGRFELANGGTLFLDEITNLSFPLQAKLLSTLQNREITRLGANLPVPIDIRLISATNVDPGSLVQDHKFREDLLFRLNTVEIIVPPLRERIDDIEILANHFIKKFAFKYRKGPFTVSRETLKYMLNYSWPGNVRELIHAVERAIILTDDKEIKKEDLALKGASSGSIASDTLNLNDKEMELIQRALKKNHGNMSNTAKDLGLGRTTLYRKMQKYGL